MSDEEYGDVSGDTLNQTPVVKRKINLGNLKKQRGTLKGRLTLFEKYVHTLKDSTLDRALTVQVNLRMQTATEFFKNFNSIQAKIEQNVDENESAAQIEYREWFEEHYYSSMAAAKCLVNVDDDKTKCTPSASENHIKSVLKLPDVKLPVFDGSYDLWLEYMNSYKTMIHKRSDLDSIQKFHYLRSSLTGSALQVISALEFTAVNYTHAWELLENRFHNNRLLVHNHVKSLFSAHAIGKESPTQIRKLIDTILRNLRALNSLGEPTESWDTLIIFLAVSKLDPSTEREWECHKGSLMSNSKSDTTSKLKLDDLLTFLRNRADMLEMISANHTKVPQSSNFPKQTNQNSSPRAPNSQQQVFTHVTTAQSNNNNTKPNHSKSGERRVRVCQVCSGNHALYTCMHFLNLSVKERIKIVEEKSVCPNCLRSGHTLIECTFGPCKQCQKKHNSLLHLSDMGAHYSSISDHPSVSTVLHSHSSGVAHTQNNPSQVLNGLSSEFSMSLQPVLLSTALVEVADAKDNYHTVRALLDNGSQRCIISDSLFKRLNVPYIQSTVQVSGVGQSVSQSSQICDLKMRSKNGDYQTNLNCLVLPTISSHLPFPSVDLNSIKIPHNIRLADPTFHISGEIDLLIGADKFWELLADDKIRLPNGPFLQSSKLGWLLSGPICTKYLRTNQVQQCYFVQSLDVQLKRFWELEELETPKDTFTADERKCEEIFVKTTSREKDGRFSVQIPLRESADALGDSYHTAKLRFLSLERKLNRLPEYKKLYCDFIREYRDLGHMTPIDEYRSPYYFLPHHGVFREDSTTTKLRVVFNASQSTDSNLSLNDIQYVGPTLQNDIFSILLRFRLYKFVACADIEKMYRQILIQPDQRMLQLILWRENPSDPLQIFRLNTVTYGNSSAPFLSIRCLWQLAQECGDDVIAEIIKNDFYVDDLILGNDDQHSLINLCERTSKVLLSGCFPLRKWTFNYDVTSDVSKELSTGEHCQSKTLGLGWLNKSDELHFTSKVDYDKTKPLTKRVMLSIIAQIYDPLGLLAPAIIIAKMMLQKLWLCKIDWEQPVPYKVKLSWDDFITTLKCLQSLRLPRYVMSDNRKHKELHIFTDASQTAYGACAYVRCYDDDDSPITVRLLCAKSKVAPLKTVTIPRLELCGALLGAKLYSHIKKSLQIPFDKVWFWTDSTIVMGWIRMSPHALKTFVQNRVIMINELTSDSLWMHVKGKENPADLVSRGLSLDLLHNCSPWWTGPTFLYSPSSQWAEIPPSEVQENLPEIKIDALTFLSHCTPEVVYDFARFSSFNRAKRVGAYLLRFIWNARTPQTMERRTGPLSVDELNQSVIMMARAAQAQCFRDVLIELKLKSQVKSNKLTGLNLFVDKDNLIRVGGRLANASSFDYNKKHPILLSGKHDLTVLVFRQEHIRLLHAGPQLILASVRETWWPIGGRSLARKIVHQCVTCTRLTGKTLTPIMGNLPIERLQSGYTFFRCGVDYGGPVMILERKGRGSRLIKSYICLFVCFTTHAVHLELVTSLSTQDYLLALKRFISRRGKPAEIFSDNGRNFVGAEKEFPLFLEQNSDHIIDYASNNNIKFSFIPPYAPHFGGLWEAGVKSCKFHLRRVAGNANLTYEEFSTVLAQIESILNSRPLTPLSSDPNDFLPLTPAHFLIGRTLTAPACKDLTSMPTGRLLRYQRVEQMRQHFWERWNKEYISELQQRTKWKFNKQDITLGSLVLIKEDGLPPLQWRMGRVTRIFPGKDNVARVAEMKTLTGTTKRAFSKICPLPVETERPDTNKQTKLS